MFLLILAINQLNLAKPSKRRYLCGWVATWAKVIYNLMYQFVALKYRINCNKNLRKMQNSDKLERLLTCSNNCCKSV